MNRRVSRPAIIGALLRKELVAYSRDLVYLVLTLAVLVLIPILFRFLPDSVDETITLAVAPSLATVVDEARAELVAQGATPEQLAALDELDLSGEEGLELLEVDDAGQLAGVVEGTLEAWRTEGGEVIVRDPRSEPEPAGAERVGADIGIAFPSGFVPAVMTGRETTVTVYTDAAVPAEIRAAMSGYVRELAYEFAGRELPVGLPAEEDVVLGEDRAGDQITARERAKPLLLFMILLMETFSMAALVSTEVVQRTVTALLVTPVRVADFLFAKAVFGTLLSLGQALIVLALIGGVTAQNWELLLVTLLMGAVMFTGIALLVGSAGRDFMGQLFLAMLFTIPLLIPAFAVLLPGSAAPWVQALPTYPIIDVLVGASVYGTTWAESWGSLAYATAWLVVIFGAGWVTLKRKVQSL
ncbi:MAG: ABC transporter permease [Actinomycetes bacterium]|nr:ABC transporter permease [Actinomycetes bacterium]MDX5381341.1 ABC transporter permease [Actinomycetes bacterium]MDX5400741.1 ABC transporter permease [Actinomycetes bacterium]MDX5451117.1 ABC transporter permease [Actinomycetes bacterium]